MNHIQWIRLFAAVQFFDGPGVACASTKRTRSGSVTRAARVHEHALISAPKMAKICDYPALRTAQKQKTGGRQPSPCVGYLKSQEANMKCSCMTLFRALFPTILVSTIAQPQLLLANPLSPPSGSYELTARLELPHLERWGVDKTAIICLSNSRGPDEIPVPVVSANNPFAKCLGHPFHSGIAECSGETSSKGTRASDIAGPAASIRSLTGNSTTYRT